MSIMHKIGRLYFKIRGAPTCEELDDLAYDFLEGKLDDKTMKAIEKHMRICPPCIHFIHSYRKIKEMGYQEDCPKMDPAFKMQLFKMFQN